MSAIIEDMETCKFDIFFKGYTCNSKFVMGKQTKY